jgi:hypothetical protein
VIVHGRHLPGFPADDHHFPVLEEEDGMTDVMAGVEADAVEIALGLASNQIGEQPRSRTLRGAATVQEDFLHGLGEGHEINSKGVRCQVLGARCQSGIRCQVPGFRWRSGVRP